MRILKRLFAHVQPYWKPLLLTAVALLLETVGRPKKRNFLSSYA